jgi:hypothetical protein
MMVSPKDFQMQISEKRTWLRSRIFTGMETEIVVITEMMAISPKARTSSYSQRSNEDELFS